ncbi:MULTISPECIES: hypothetical protein [unclassified Paenibacillus]|uniref:hypothetical protein n=1 Tax=unclassified Paenibacillus TaxID=185978 RepID=UPI001AE15ACE|nr:MULTISPECIES: hypothetical protein [unclassified Paenibacillus]MBP1153790.1 hypothetical protein [Paenibacillus sp. PvP091]MBP1170825.1 hypothetical protein [Paenibacillus sp. PvR098]MBP2441853.1 hypothetical protein [Paenibacillus sp. PvP052]
MISNRELKGQMDQLTEQNQYLTEELEQIKAMLKQQMRNQGQNSSNQNSQNAGGGHSQSSGSSGSNGGRSNGSNGSGGSSASGISELAKDFSKLKDLTSQLEEKMSNYIAEQSSNKPMSDEDAVNLILTMMNGMIDWSMDLLSKSSNSSNQQQ